jgi:hypothetical protein
VSRIQIKSKQPLGLGGRILGSLFFLVFFGMGSLFCVFIGREFYLNLQTRGWTPTECVIVESRVEENRKSSENPYGFAVRYEYQWQGRTYSSTQWSRQRTHFDDYSKAQRLASKYALDTKATCLVDPRNPESAVLEKPTLWIGLVVLFPLIFVGIGLIGIVAMWRSSEAKEKPEERILSNRPALSARGTKLGRVGGAVFFSFFFLIGSVVFFLFFVRPALSVLSARNWPATPCQVVSSDVQRHRGSKGGTTYRVDVLYSYEVNGREFRSNRYAFMGGSSSGYKGKAAIVARYPAGAKAVCFVNPSDPTEAVLERGFTADLWFGLIPLVFVLVGAGGILFSLRGGRSRPSDASPYEPMSMSQISGVTPGIRPVTGMAEFVGRSGDLSGPRVLKSSSSKLAAVIGIGIFAAIWNGVIFFGFILNSGFFRRGRTDFFDWFGVLFMIPFVAIGLFLIGLLIYQILGLFNPKVELTLAPGAPQLGDKIDVTWRLSGRTQVLRGLKIYVEAREEARYRRGTSTYTDRKPFLKLQVYASASSMEAETGHASVTLPLESIPTWKSDNNKIVWAIHVTGEIPRWPDLKEEFVIEVHPPRVTVAA